MRHLKYKFLLKLPKPIQKITIKESTLIKIFKKYRKYYLYQNSS